MYIIVLGRFCAQSCIIEGKKFNIDGHLCGALLIKLNKSHSTTSLGIYYFLPLSISYILHGIGTAIELRQHPKSMCVTYMYPKLIKSTLQWNVALRQMVSPVVLDEFRNVKKYKPITYFSIFQSTWLRILWIANDCNIVMDNIHQRCDTTEEFWTYFVLGSQQPRFSCAFSMQADYNVWRTPKLKWFHIRPDSWSCLNNSAFFRFQRHG